jgi:hypothetical protein
LYAQLQNLLYTLDRNGRLRNMILQPMFQGISLSATVVFVTAISNGLSTYLLGGATLEDKVKGKIGGQ